MANTNWIFNNGQAKKETERALKEVKKKEAESEDNFEYVPHPTIAKTMIRRKKKC